MYICKFCGSARKNANSLRNHERLCKLNPDYKKIEKTENFYKAMHKRKDTHTGTNQYTRAKLLGLPKPIMSKETRLKLSESSKMQTWDADRRLRHSIAMNKAVINNPNSYSSHNVCGRSKRIEYNGKILLSSWEYIVAKFLDSNNIEWTNELTPFKYEWNNSTHLYFPDFYLPKYNLYIEVKGYERERDLAKWKVVDNLIIIKKDDINAINNGQYNLNL